MPLYRDSKLSERKRGCILAEKFKSATDITTYGGTVFNSPDFSVNSGVDLVPSSKWTWVGGSNVVNQNGIFGTKGIPDGSNIPGSMACPAYCVDGVGGAWLFGGYGYDSVGTIDDLNDLWHWDGTNWTWVSGDSLAAQNGVYGVKGVADPANKPGGRDGAVLWMGGDGSLWLFGGNGYDSVGSWSALNDLWKWDGTNWTWVHGPDTSDQSGTYGTKGVSDVSNVPGARYYPGYCTGPDGNMWVYGGSGYDAYGSWDELADLWKWDGTNWTWMAGSDTAGITGVYGTKGVSDPANIPGGRDYSCLIYSGSDFFVFGGYGYDGSGSLGYLNDLWKWDGTNWTWVSGSSTKNQYGTYNSKGIVSASSVPGGRFSGYAWADSNEHLFLVGGNGYAASTHDFLEDVWRWDGTSWTWLYGSNASGVSTVFGIKGVASSSNVLGGRGSNAVWFSKNKLWSFGGGKAIGVDKWNDFWCLNNVVTSNTDRNPIYDQYIVAQSKLDYIFSNGSTDKPFSVSVRVMMREASDFVIANKPGEFLLYCNGSEGDKVQFIIYDKNGTSYIGRESGISLTAYENKWVDIAATYDGSSSFTGVKIYIDGSLSINKNIFSGSYTCMPSTGADIYLGKSSSYVSDGRIKDFKVWGCELTSEEASDLYRKSTMVDIKSSILYSDFSSFSNSPLRNAVDSSKTGTIIYMGDGSTSSTYPSSLSNGLRFDGVDDYLLALRVGGAYIPTYTAVCLFRLNQLVAESCLIEMNGYTAGAGDAGEIVYLNASGNLVLSHYNMYFTTTGYAADKQWHIMVMTHSGNDTSLYIDDDNVSSYLSAPVSGSYAIYFGAMFGGAIMHRYASMDMKFAAVYPVVFTRTQILEVMDQVRTKYLR